MYTPHSVINTGDDSNLGGGGGLAGHQPSKGVQCVVTTERSVEGLTHTHTYIYTGCLDQTTTCLQLRVYLGQNNQQRLQLTLGLNGEKTGAFRPQLTLPPARGLRPSRARPLETVKWSGKTVNDWGRLSEEGRRPLQNQTLPRSL